MIRLTNALEMRKIALCLTSRQPSNAGVIRRLAFTKLANDSGKRNEQQVKPALRLPAGRYVLLNLFYAFYHL
jgi:hypothetical protein